MSDTTGQVISLMIVEDHPLFREGLRRVLEIEPTLKVIAEASDGEEAITLAAEISPDVILMDINLPKLNGLQATREIVGKIEDAKIIPPYTPFVDARIAMTEGSGKFTFTNDRVEIENLTGHIEGISYRINGDIRGFDADAPFRFASPP